MPKETFQYVTYIAATRERVWDALLKPEFTRMYWGHDNVSDWTPGAAWEHRRNDPPHAVRITGKVVEIDRPRRLVLTWAFPDDAKNEAAHTRVTFELDQIESMVKLTVTHADLTPGSDMDRGIREGWPRVLASLKSFLETGTALPTWAGKKG
jgi:uncharacterized protein YndB with AHSA1/START domain